MGERKEKADLEQLLNRLIEKGWLPRGEDKIHSCKFDKRENKFMANYTRSGCFKVMYRSLTEICSKGSGLWQFVCENNLVPIMCDEEWIKHYYKDIDDDNLISGENIQPTTEYEYRLIESSLKDESELEQFLLSNIKVDEQILKLESGIYGGE